MTALELKTSYRRDVPQSNRSEDAKLQAIIRDILTKKNYSRENVDEKELIMHLEHAHHKVDAILNRVPSLSIDRSMEEMLL